MYLEWLRLMNFKNCEEREFSFSRGIHCITGANGKGKTNVLDAIYYLSFTRSFLQNSDSHNIRWNEPYFMVEGRFNDHDNEDLVQISFKRGQKKSVRRNKKEYEKLSDHIGLFPSVMICPQYVSIITGGSEERRRWMDMLISQFDHLYLQQLMNYQRILQQRNTLIRQMNELRRWDESTLLIYDEQLDMYGQQIFEGRNRFMKDFMPVFKELYAGICGNQEEVHLSYSSVLEGETSLKSVLYENRAKDRALQYTAAGIHKDDLEFSLNEVSMKKFGSQGQQKSYLTSLKLAEYLYLSQKLGKLPILMLDDIFDKLDGQRVKSILQKIAQPEFGQVFITDTGSHRLQELFNELETTAQFHSI